MLHLNKNLLCAISVKSTGHEILEFAVVPLTNDLKVSEKHSICNLLIKPEFPNLALCSKKDLSEALLHGIDTYEASELLLTWFGQLDIPPGKQIMVLTHDWNSKEHWFFQWLQPIAFNLVFNSHYRDILSVGLWMNDYADRKSEPWPFPKTTLKYMASQLRIDGYEQSKLTVIDECRMIIQIYRRLVYQDL
jgi:hypothetical protein